MGIDAAWASFEAIASEVSIKGRTTFLSLIYSMVSLSSFVFYLVGPSIYDYGGYKLTIIISGICILISIILIKLLKK